MFEWGALQISGIGKAILGTQWSGLGNLLIISGENNWLSRQSKPITNKYRTGTLDFKS